MYPSPPKYNIHLTNYPKNSEIKKSFENRFYGVLRKVLYKLKYCHYKLVKIIIANKDLRVKYPICGCQHDGASQGV